MLLSPVAPAGYTPLLSMYANDDSQLAPLAVLNGQADGVVLQLAETRLCRSFLVHTGHRLYLAGDPDPLFAGALHTWMTGTLLPAVRSAGEWGVGLYFNPPDWRPLLEQVLAASPGFIGSRYYYERELNKDEIIDPDALPPGFSLCQVDANLLDDSAIIGLAALREEMCSERSSTDDFLARSFGYALFAEQSLAGWCLSEYNLAQRCEVGIATLEPYQRRGCATAAGLAFLHLAREYDYRRIGWHCWANNRASAATAERLGFRLAHQYDCFGCHA